LQHLNSSQNVPRADKWLLELFEDSNRTPIAATGISPEIEEVATILWSMWKARNNAVFRGLQPNPIAILEEARAHATTYIKWNPHNSKSRSRSRKEDTGWLPPTNPNLKLNVDASWVGGEIPSSIAGILRNSSGMVEGGFACEIRAETPLQAETLAAVKGLKFLKQIQETHVWGRQKETVHYVCESDNLTVVESLLGREEASWEVRNLVQEGKSILAQFSQAKTTHCPREGN